MSLETYNHKRDFAKTSEPRGQEKPPKDESRFVVQEHHASHLHYDFRLEIDGVLKSWAVPNGLPPRSGIRRLAIMTEDHPIEYLTFSGLIPEESYGAGIVTIWDAGTFESLADRDPLTGVQRGKLELMLHGERLSGKYDMIRIDDDKNQWIMILTKDQSVISHPPKDEISTSVNSESASSPAGSKTAPMPDPSRVQPMLAETLDQPFDDGKWQFEIKWDGYRALLFKNGNKQALWSRNHIRLSSKFPELCDLADRLQCTQGIVDGEIVALDENGVTHFQELQNRLGRGGLRGRLSSQPQAQPRSEIVFMAFDLIYLDGFDITGATLEARRRLLQSLVLPDGRLRFSDHVTGSGKALFEKATAAGLEGIMAKKSDSLYTTRRSNNWFKIKAHHTEDVVIGGFTESKAEGRAFASLLIGQFDHERLIPLGHVGTGFDGGLMKTLLGAMRPLEVKSPPFAEDLVVNGTPHWLKPELSCEVKFSELTVDHQLRHPVFLRLRPDKPATECKFSHSL